jgi:hypothetical protein
VTDVQSEFPDSYIVVRSSSSLQGLSGACLNCEAPLAGPYCARCGQRDLPPEPPLRELIAEAWDTFVSVDGKVANTLRLLVAQPGALTREYLTGRRARFLPPLRLYLLCSLVFFLLDAAAPKKAKPSVVTISGAPVVATDLAKKPKLDSAQLALKIDSIKAEGDNWFARRLKVNGLRVGNDGYNFSQDWNTQVPRTLFVLMPVFALLLAVAYRSRRRSYATHLVVALHLHAFVFIALAIGVAARWLPNRIGNKFVTPLIALWLIAYVPLALRRVYGGRVWPVLLRTGALVVEYAILAVVAFTAMAMLLLLFY